MLETTAVPTATAVISQIAGADWWTSLLNWMGFPEFIRQIEQNFIAQNRWLRLLEGLGVTVELSIFSIILGLCIGVMIAMMRLSTFQVGRIRPLSTLAGGYLTVIRGTPALVQLLVFAYIFFGGTAVPMFYRAVIAFGVNSGAYVAEIIRAGILSVDHGQTEAGRSLGFSRMQTLRYIVMPQAIKNVLPALGNEFIVLIKETAIVGYVAVEDLTKVGDIIRSRTFSATYPLFAVALLYLLLVMLLTFGLRKLEGRLRASDHR